MVCAAVMVAKVVTARMVLVRRGNKSIWNILMHWVPVLLFHIVIIK